MLTNISVTRTWPIAHVILGLACWFGSEQVNAQTVTPATKSVEELIQELQGTDLQARREAAWDLAAMGSAAEAAVDALAIALEDRDTQVVNGALHSLGEIGPSATAALPAIAKRLRDGNAQHRYRAAFATGRVADPGSDIILSGFATENARLRAATVEATGWMGPRAAPLLPKLLPLLSDPDAEVGQQVMESLCRIGEASGPGLTAVLQPPYEASDATAHRAQLRAAKVLGRLGTASRPAIAILLQCSAHPDPGVRAAVIEALGNIAADDNTVVQRIAAALDDPDLTVQAAALTAMIAEPRIAMQAVDRLPARLEADPQVANLAALALGRAGAAVLPAVPQLVQRITDHNRAAVVNCISRLGAPAVPHLLEAVAQQSTSPQIAAEILDQIGLASETELRAALTSSRPSDRLTACLGLGRLKLAGRDVAVCLADTDPEVQIAAAAGLAHLGPSASFARDALLESLSHTENTAVRTQCLATLVAIQAPLDDLLPPLVAGLGDTDASTRQQSAATLGQLSDVPAEVVSALAQALHDPVASVRRAAVQALAKHPGQVHAAAHQLVEATHDVESDIVELAASTLATLEPYEEATLKRLADLLDHPDVSVRSAALAALGRVGPAAQFAQPQLEALLTDASAEIRAAAISALAGIQSDAQLRLDYLRRGLDDRDWSVRRKATEQMATMGADAVAVVPRLLELLQSPEDAEAVNAALRRIDAAPPEAIPQLLQILKDPNGERRQRFYALYLLRKLGPAAKEALPVLKELRESAEGRMQEFLDRAIMDISA